MVLFHISEKRDLSTR